MVWPRTAAMFALVMTSRKSDPSESPSSIEMNIERGLAPWSWSRDLWSSHNVMQSMSRSRTNYSKSFSVQAIRDRKLNLNIGAWPLPQPRSSTLPSASELLFGLPLTVISVAYSCRIVLRKYTWALALSPQRAEPTAKSASFHNCAGAQNACAVMSRVSIPFISRLEACLDTRVMRSAGIIRLGIVKERLKRILSNLEPGKQGGFRCCTSLRRPSGHQALPILHNYFDLHQDTSSSETLVQLRVSKQS